MRALLARVLLDRLLPQTCPDEDFFSAGPLGPLDQVDEKPVSVARTTAARPVVRHRPHHAA